MAHWVWLVQSQPGPATFFCCGLSGNILYVILLTDLSDHCPVIPLQMLEVWLCQWPSLTGWREERTGSSSLNFFQAVFTRVVVESSQPPAATGSCEHVSYVAKRSYHLQLVRSDLDFPLWSAVQAACSSLPPCTSLIRLLCQMLQPTAFLVHPVLAAIAEDDVAAHSSVTDSTWKLSWTLQEVQASNTDHHLCLSCIYTRSPFSSIASFFVWFSNDNKVIGIEVFPGDPRVIATDKVLF